MGGRVSRRDPAAEEARIRSAHERLVDAPALGRPVILGKQNRPALRVSTGPFLVTRQRTRRDTVSDGRSPGFARSLVLVDPLRRPGARNRCDRNTGIPPVQTDVRLRRPVHSGRGRVGVVRECGGRCGGYDFSRGKWPVALHVKFATLTLNLQNPGGICDP